MGLYHLSNDKVVIVRSKLTKKSLTCHIELMIDNFNLTDGIKEFKLLVVMQYSKSETRFVLQWIYLCTIHIHRARINMNSHILWYYSFLTYCDVAISYLGLKLCSLGALPPRPLFIAANSLRQFAVLSLRLLIYCSYYHIVNVTPLVYSYSFCLLWRATSTMSESTNIDYTRLAAFIYCLKPK